MLVEGEVREVYAGCLRSNIVCGGLAVCAVGVDDESGACVVFSSTCYPENFKEVECRSGPTSGGVAGDRAQGGAAGGKEGGGGCAKLMQALAASQ